MNQIRPFPQLDQHFQQVVDLALALQTVLRD
jgi:hypothetical protein